MKELQFVGSEAEVNRKVFQKLLPYFNWDKVVVVGGLAIAHHLDVTGAAIQTHPRLRNFDLIHQDDGAIRPSIVEAGIWVAHYHPLSPEPGSDPGSYWMFVDPESKRMINVYGTKQWPCWGSWLSFDRQPIWLICLENQLIALVHGLQRLDWPEFADNPRLQQLQPKHLFDVLALTGAADLTEAQILWEKAGYHAKFDRDLVSAIDHAIEIVNEDASLLNPYPFRKPGRDYICPDCQSTEFWPVKSFAEIYDLLEGRAE